MSDTLRAELDQLMMQARAEFQANTDHSNLVELASVLDRFFAARADLARAADIARSMRQGVPLSAERASGPSMPHEDGYQVPQGYNPALADALRRG